MQERRRGRKNSFFNGKEGFYPLEGEPKGSKRLLKVVFRTLRLFHHVPKEQAITDDISSPHDEVEDGSDVTYVTMDVQLIPKRVRPLLLLRRRHANPEQIRVDSIDGINDCLVVSLPSSSRITKERRQPRYILPFRIPTYPRRSQPAKSGETFDWSANLIA